MKRQEKKIKTLIDMGKHLIGLSTCGRLQVACIIFPTDCSAIYAIGYNGPPRGLPNDNCKFDNVAACGCAHAEVNAIAKFNNDLAKPSILWTSRKPCHHCASVMLNCGKIIGVVWSEDYRDGFGEDLIKQAGVCIVHESYIQGLIRDLNNA